MQEWFNWHAWKACVPQKGTGGSNPPLSAKAKIIHRRSRGIFILGISEPCSHERGKPQNKKTIRVKRVRDYFGFEAPPPGINSVNPPLSAKAKINTAPAGFYILP